MGRYGAALKERTAPPLIHEVKSFLERPYLEKLLGMSHYMVGLRTEVTLYLAFLCLTCRQN
jgi:hypothetical protein